MRRALGAAVLTLVLVAPAAAHEELALDSLTVVDSIPATLDGLDLRVVHLGAPAFVVDNRTEVALTVLDDDGRPFLEIGPDGVRADVSSELFYESVVPGTHDHLKPRHSAAATWVTFARSPRWTWFDPRLAWTGQEREWEVEFRYGRTRTSVSGGFEPLAHHGHFVSRIQPPSIEGLDLRLAQGPVPVVYVRNDTGRVLEVLGAGDEPFLRIGPRGTYANVMSPTYYSSGGLTIRDVPRWADATAHPRWKRLSGQPVWAWLEYRAAISSGSQQRDRLGSKPATIHSWTSPMTLDGRELSVRGGVRWVPPDAGFHPESEDAPGRVLPRAVLYAGGAVMIAIALLVVRRPRASIA